VEVECAGARLRVRIADDGCGFRVDKAVAGDGLRNMDLRARALNGVIEVRSQAGQGTTVALDVPV
jgi:signal transduction histidine kinase